MKVKVATPDPKEPVLVMRRTFDAPRALVWNAFTDPRHVARWYGGHGFSNPVCEMDVRPGGRWRHVMRTPDGAEYPLEFVFVEVVEPERLVWKPAGKVPPGPHRNVMTVTLAEAGRKTEWTLVVRFDSLADRDEAARGNFLTVLDQGSERLEALLRSGERL